VDEMFQEKEWIAWSTEAGFMIESSKKLSVID
jgi:hypothetical protein